MRRKKAWPGVANQSALVEVVLMQECQPLTKSRDIADACQPPLSIILRRAMGGMTGDTRMRFGLATSVGQVGSAFR